MTIFASNKQGKCIIVSNLDIFGLKFNKMCKFFNTYEESLHLGVCKLAKYVRNCVVFWKNLHSWQKFYTTAGRDGRDKFQVWQWHQYHIDDQLQHFPPRIVQLEWLTAQTAGERLKKDLEHSISTRCDISTINDLFISATKTWMLAAAQWTNWYKFIEQKHFIYGSYVAAAMTAVSISVRAN